MIRGIIFDLDGVLIDAVEWHFTALNRALHLFGFQLTREEHLELYDGLPTLQKLELLSERRGLPKNLHGFIAEMKQRFTEEILVAECSPAPDKIQLLENLRRDGYTLAVASNCIRSTVETVLQRMDIKQYFDCVLSREEVAHPKPSPAMFLECMRRMALTPDECLILEDSKPGLEAARLSHAHIAAIKNPKEVTLAFIRQRLFADETGESTTTGALEIVIPMAGEGQRFRAAGYELPKPMIDIHGKPMIDWVVQNVRPKFGPHHFTFLCNQNHLEKYRLAEHLHQIAPGCSIVAVPNTTEGAACTVLLASDSVNPQNELLLANSDQFVDSSIEEFLKSARGPKLDGHILTFPSRETKWSYAKLNQENLVTQVAEKSPISPHATVGIYYFRSAAAFFEAAQAMIRKNTRTNGEFYVCPVYNELIAKACRVGIHSIAPSAMHGLGTPEDLASFLQRRTAQPRRPKTSSLT